MKDIKEIERKVLKVNNIPCIGCFSCEAICSIFHFKRNSRELSAIRVELEPFSGLNEIIFCRQCEDAECAQVCPTESIIYNKEKFYWYINRDTCISCGQCVEACPYEAMFWSEEIGGPLKCDLCGGDPECVKACHFSVLFFVRESEEIIKGIPEFDQDEGFGRY